MQIGIALPSNWGLPDPMALVDMAVEADTLGFSAVWLGEHILNVGYIEERLGDRPYFSPIALLPFMAARTEHIKLGTSVLVLPNHHPATLAKYLATLDHLCNGRLIVGIGCGGNEPEFDAMGLSFADRGKITNEMLEIMNALFTQTRATHHGERWNFDEILFSPKPKQHPLPIWVGGMFDSAPSLRRTAKYGTGWQPAGLSASETAEAVKKIRDMAFEFGRDPSSIKVSVPLGVDYGLPLAFEAERITLISSENPETMAAELRVWAAHGVDDVVLRLNVTDVDRLRSEVARIGNEVLPLLQ